MSASFTAGTTAVSNRFRSSGLRPWSPDPYSCVAFASASPHGVLAFHRSPMHSTHSVRSAIPSWSLGFYPRPFLLYWLRTF